VRRLRRLRGQRGEDLELARGAVHLPAADPDFVPCLINRQITGPQHPGVRLGGPCGQHQDGKGVVETERAAAPAGAV